MVPNLPPISQGYMIGSLLPHEESLRCIAGYAELARRLDNPRMRTVTIGEMCDIVWKLENHQQRFSLIHTFGLDGGPRLTYREIADNLHCTPNQAHYHMHLALRIVRREALEVWAKHDSETVDTFNWR